MKNQSGMYDIEFITGDLKGFQTREILKGHLKIGDIVPVTQPDEDQPDIDLIDKVKISEVIRLYTNGVEHG